MTSALNHAIRIWIMDSLWLFMLIWIAAFIWLVMRRDQSMPLHIKFFWLIWVLDGAMLIEYCLMSAARIVR